MSSTSAHTPPRGRGRPPSIDREVALDAAVRTFWECGYDGASLTDLTVAMGLSRPSLYAAFGDKEALFLRALDRYGETIGGVPMAAFDAEPDLRAAVRAFLETSLRSNTEPGGPKGCLFACCAGAVAPANPTVADLLDRVFRGAADHIEHRFREAVGAGRLTPDPTPAARAAVAVDMMNAQAVRARAGAMRRDLLAGLEARVAAILGPAPKDA